MRSDVDGGISHEPSVADQVLAADLVSLSRVRVMRVIGGAFSRHSKISGPCSLRFAQFGPVSKLSFYPPHHPHNIPQFWGPILMILLSLLCLIDRQARFSRQVRWFRDKLSSPIGAAGIFC
jgi:hypothetical protein